MALTWDNRQKGKGNYYLRGTIRGETIYETTGTDDEEVAQALCITRAAELLQRSVHGPRSVATFGEAAARHLEQGGDPRFLGKKDPETGVWDGLIGHFGKRKLMDITQDDLNAAALKLHPGCTASTLDRQVYSPFIAAWNAGTPDLCEVRRWQRPRRPKKSARGRKRWSSVDEFERLHAAAAPHLRGLLLFLVLTGCRPIEAFHLEWGDVDLNARWVVFFDTKNQQNRGVALHRQLVVMLANMKGEKKGRVFRTQKGKPYAEKDDSGGQTKSAWASAVRKAGICKTGHKVGYRRRRMADGSIGDRYEVKVKHNVWAKGEEPLVLYSLRHTCATWLLMAGVQEQVKDEIIGHESTTMGRNYAHVPRPYITAAVDLLPSLNLLGATAKPCKIRVGAKR